jgi:hypothetical protein
MNAISNLSRRSDTVADQFRRDVVPLLEERIPHAALAIVAGDDTCTSAYSLLLKFAWDRGGCFLPERHMADLEIGLHSRLMKAIRQVERDADVEAIERVHADLAVHAMLMQRALGNG